MATITPTVSNPDGDAVVLTWANMANGDSGAAVTYPGFGDASFQVTGTFGSGGTLLVEGSNDGANFASLTDPQGNALSFTAAKIEQIEEAVLKYRPRVSAGDGTTALTVTAYFRRTSR